MKTFFTLIAAFISLTQTSAFTIGVREPRLEVRSAAGCGNSDAVPLLRGYSRSATDHFYTTNSGEMENAVANLGYASEGDAALVFTTQEPSTTPLYRLYNGHAADHFYTTSASERDNAAQNDGYTEEGTQAFVYSTQICGSIPLFRVYNPSVVDHFYTTSGSERDNAITNLGYVDEGTAAFVLQAP